MNLTEEQKSAISSRGHVIVSASAGSGKTFVMIERLVSLILGGADVRNMLAVTFTEKAAAQIRERLRLALLERIARGEDRARLKEQLEALPLAQVSTIHAFCARLVRTYFFLAGVDAGFRIVSPDDAESRMLSARALDEVFDAAYEEGSAGFELLLGTYFRRKKDDKLRSLVLSAYSAVRGRSDDREVLEGTGRKSHFDDACGYLREELLGRVRLLRERAAALPLAGNARAEKVASAIVLACDGLLSAGDLFDMANLASEPPAIPNMPPMTKAEGEELSRLKLLSGLSRAVKDVYSELRGYASREREQELAADAEARAAALAELVLRYGDAFSRLKNEAGVLDYDDLEHFALRILSDERARAETREKYRYLFVDEYQDVNPVQDELLSLLAGDEVFFVGDGKQAIYAFRGSKSRFFEEKTRSLPVSLQLSENFRSAPAVLEAANRVFAPVIGGYIPMRGGARYGEHAGEVRFLKVGKGETAEREELRVYSVLHDVTEPKPDPLAERVAAAIEEELDAGVWFDADAGEQKRVRFGDIAVLVRKNSGDAERIVRALEARDIPVVTTARVNVCDFFEARLLIDALSYLDNAEQDIPLASLLLSAAGGFDESELATVRLAFPSAPTFREACRLYGEGKDGLAQKLQGFFGLCGKLRDRARTHTAAEIANELLSLGLEAQIAAKRDGEIRLSRVRRLIAEAGQLGVHAFLTRLKATNYDVRDTGGAGDAVKVLTMHASKGLEFPVVFLAGLDAPFHGADTDEIMWTDRFGIVPRSYDAAHKYVYENILRRASAAVQTAEDLVGERNLLYVAMTRARYRLYLAFGNREKERALSPMFAGRLSDFFDPAFLAERLYAPQSAPPPLARPVPPARADAALEEELLSRYEAPYPFGESNAPAKSSATDLLRLEEDVFVRAEGAEGEFSSERGTAYHEFLQNVRFGEDAGAELARMRAEGVLSEETLSLLEEEKLRAILALPCFAGLEGKRLYREQKFLVGLPARELLPTDSEDEVIYQGAIDLLVEAEEGFTVIDYKYSSRDDENLKEHYAVQIKLYRKAVARATGTDERGISARIVNIALLREIPM